MFNTHKIQMVMKKKRCFILIFISRDCAYHCFRPLQIHFIIFCLTRPKTLFHRIASKCFRKVCIDTITLSGHDIPAKPIEINGLFISRLFSIIDWKTLASHKISHWMTYFDFFRSSIIIVVQNLLATLAKSWEQFDANNWIAVVSHTHA